MSKDDRCLCGHPRTAHIYETGACRPGWACVCVVFRPAEDDHADRTVDPLAEVIQKALADYDSADLTYGEDAKIAARVARDHIAAEIEADIRTGESQNRSTYWIREGQRIAAGIARGDVK
jgi:hypothetical protein